MVYEPTDPQALDPTAQRPGWLTHLAIAAMVGVALGSVVGTPVIWLSMTLVVLLLGVAALCKRPMTDVSRYLILAATVGGFANWYQVQHRYLPADDIRQYATDQSQLIELAGTITSPIHMSTPRRGALGHYSYQSPATLFVMRAEHITRNGVKQSASGNTLVKIRQVDVSLQPGDRIRITGWFRSTQGPANPGEFDYRKMLAQQDIFTRVSLPSARNLHKLESAGGFDAFGRFRAWCAARANRALSLGAKHNSRELGLLQIMLLGQRGGNLGDLDKAFREVGLAHLLSISGAHLSILLFLTYLGAMMLTQYPRRQILIVTVVLIFYLVVVPMRVPIARAGVMAGAFCFCSLMGLTLGPINVLGLATLVVLFWRPADLFTPGFELSFGTVAALIIFTPRVSSFLWPDPQVQLIDRTRHRLARRAADYFSVNIVAFCTALPMVAYHYQMISPWNMILTMLALPIVTVMLGLGFTKILLGVFFPSSALMLNGLTVWAARMLASLVESGRTWPYAHIGLGAGPSVWWMLSVLMVVFAMFCGVFANRRRLLGAVVGVCALWLVIPLMPTWRLLPTAAVSPKVPMATLHSISVGNGSCFLLRLRPDKRFERDRVILFDCGSQRYLDVGKRTVVPVLNNLNIRQIDYLILSHADIDHYGGSLDVADEVTIKQVLLPQHMIDDARDHPLQATAKLLAGLQQRQIPIQVVGAGWSLQFEGHDLQMLWPPPETEYPTQRHNDSSLVLSLRTCGRRLLLNGDIQQRAITQMFARHMDLKADITDLPHHGAIVPATLDWLKAVHPSVIVQSAGWSRMYHDKWPALLKQTDWPMQRLVTTDSGLVTVQIAADGTISTQRFADVQAK